MLYKLRSTVLYTALKIVKFPVNPVATYNCKVLRSCCRLHHFMRQYCECDMTMFIDCALFRMVGISLSTVALLTLGILNLAVLAAAQG